MKFCEFCVDHIGRLTRTFIFFQSTNLYTLTEIPNILSLVFSVFINSAQRDVNTRTVFSSRTKAKQNLTGLRYYDWMIVWSVRLKVRTFWICSIASVIISRESNPANRISPFVLGMVFSSSS